MDKIFKPVQMQLTCATTRIQHDQSPAEDIRLTCDLCIASDKYSVILIRLYNESWDIL